jgi:general secretion pathway protein G
MMTRSDHLQRDIGRKIRWRQRASGGFTLIELLITLVIIALLASGAVSLWSVAVQRQKESDLRSNLRQIREAIDAYKYASDTGRIPHAVDASGYPPSLESLAAGIEDAKSPDRRRIYFLRRVPRDPFADPSLPPEKTWGLRSYASPPDDPQPGKDVYDVYSQSEKQGLNGVPYSLW